MPFTDELLQFVDKPCFLETGTFKGDTLAMVLNACVQKKVISLELSKVFFENCVNRFKSYPNVCIHHSNSKTELFNIIRDIPTEITFWLDSHWSGTPDVGFDTDTLCPILYELNQIKEHPIKTHTIMIDDVRLMTSTKDIYQGFDISLQDIVRKIYDINPNYHIQYLDDFTGPKDILVATILENIPKRICTHKYLTKCQTNPQPPGFADFLRGTIALFNLSQTYGYELVIDRTHPLFRFMKHDPLEDTPKDTIELLPPYSYDVIYQRLNELFSKQSSFCVMTNSFYTVQNRSIENWGEITDSCRDFIQRTFEPSNAISSKIVQIKQCYYNLKPNDRYKTIHIRTCDKNIHESQFDDRQYNAYFTKINNLLNSDKSHTYVLISDCSILSNRLKKDIPVLCYWDNQKTHLGDLINHSGSALSDTLCDFFILSTSDEICYITESGFSKIVSLVYRKKYTQI
jgi:hypothetical protein